MVENDMVENGLVENDNHTIRTVAWSELLPWLILFRCFRLAIRPRALLPCAAAVLLTVSGWEALGLLLDRTPDQAEGTESEETCAWLEVIDLVPDKPGHLVTAPTSPTYPSANPILGTWEQLSRPVRQVFAADVTWRRLAFLLPCGLWGLLIWGYFGGAVSRSAAVELATGDRLGWGPMFGHARSKCLAYFFAPLLPLMGVAVATGLTAVAGLLLRFGLGVLLTGLFVWPLMLLGWLLMALLLLGLAFGWPLMWATISTEGSDSFDALSRSYAYTFQRPLNYLFYAVVAAAIGTVGWLLVSNFAAGTVYLTYWAAGWGGGEQVGQIALGGQELGTLTRAGAAVIRFWCGCVKLVAVGFLYSYFWTAVTAIYLLLRHDVDATEMDEVFLEEDQDEPSYGLPSLQTDDAGAPVVND